MELEDIVGFVPGFGTTFAATADLIAILRWRSSDARTEPAVPGCEQHVGEHGHGPGTAAIMGILVRTMFPTPMVMQDERLDFLRTVLPDFIERAGRVGPQVANAILSGADPKPTYDTAVSAVRLSPSTRRCYLSAACMVLCRRRGHRSGEHDARTDALQER